MRMCRSSMDAPFLSGLVASAAESLSSTNKPEFFLVTKEYRLGITLLLLADVSARWVLDTELSSTI